MASSLQVEPEPSGFSRTKLVAQDSTPGIYFPLTTNIPTDSDVPAANYDVLLVAEFSRMLWHDGAAKIGRPRAHPASCVQVSLLLLLAELASKSESNFFIEILVDSRYPVSSADHRADPGSVRGYRVWWPASMQHITTASQVLAELLSGPDSNRCKRTIDGTTKLVVPGKFAVTHRRFYSEAQYLSAVQAYNMGLYQGYNGGLSYEAAVSAAGGPGGRDAVPEHGCDEEDPDDDTFYGNGAAAQGSNGAVLHESHALACFEASRLFDQSMTDNRHDAFGLSPQQRLLDEYTALTGQLKFPRPELVVPVHWKRSSVFSDADSLCGFLLPDLFPGCAQIQEAIGQAVEAQGGDVWRSLRKLTTSELLKLFEPDVDMPLADPTWFSPIRAAPHSLQPSAALKVGFGPSAMARAFFVVERSRALVASIRKAARSHDEVDANAHILKRVKQLYEAPADAGIPTTYYEVYCERQELQALLDQTPSLARKVNRIRTDRARMRRHAERLGCPVDFGSVLVFQIAETLTSGMNMTNVQAVPLFLMAMSLCKLGEHSCKDTRMVFSLEGHIALGKTFILQALAALNPKSMTQQETTRSAAASNEHLTNKAILRDDVCHLNSPDQNAQLKQELSNSVQSYTVNEAHPSGIGRHIQNYEFVRNCHHYWSSNAELPGALADRSIQISMLDNADAGGGRSKMDLASAPTREADRLAHSIAFKILIMDTVDFWKLESIGGFSTDCTMFYVCLSLMRTIMGQHMTLTTRLVGHAKQLTRAMMAARVTQQYERVMKQLIVAGDPDADIDSLRLDFYRVRSYVTVCDFMQVVSSLTQVANKERYVLEVAAEIRNRIQFEQGDQEPTYADDPLYFVTDLGCAVPDIADSLRATLTSMKGEGLVTTCVHKLMQRSYKGQPVLKVTSARGRGGKKLLVLRDFIVKESVTTDLERRLWRVLYRTYQTSSVAPVDDRVAAVKFENEDEIHPDIVFRDVVRDYLYDPMRDPHNPVLEDILAEPKEKLSRTLAFMQMKQLRIRNAGGGYLQEDVANVIDPTTIPLVPPDAKAVPKGGPTDKMNPGKELVQWPKTWLNCMVVPHTALEKASRPRLSEEDSVLLHNEVLNAALAVEGAVSTGEAVALSVLGTPCPATNHPCTSAVYCGMPEDWEIKVRNPCYVYTEPDDDCSDEDELDVFDDADTDVFPRSCEEVTFSVKSNLSQRIERRKAQRETGALPAEWLMRCSSDMAYNNN